MGTQNKEDSKQQNFHHEILGGIAVNSYPTGALTLYCFDKNGVDIDNLIEWTVNGQTYNNAGNCLIIDWSTGVQADGATVFCIVKQHPRNGWQQVQGDVVGNALTFV